MNNTEHTTMDSEEPNEKYADFVAEPEQAARDDCASLVPPGYNHNCYTTDGIGASQPDLVFESGMGTCVGGCSFFLEPKKGGCGRDPNPFECEKIKESGGDGDTGPDDSESDGAEAETAGEDGGESPVPGGVDLGLYLSCDDTSCTIDRALLDIVAADPKLALYGDTQLIFDPDIQRFVFLDVGSDSIAEALLFNSGDRLESINGRTLDSIDAALEMAATSQNEDRFEVVLLRGTQWTDLNYFVVP